MGKYIYAACFIVTLTTTTEAYQYCFNEAGYEYGIAPQILRGISTVESNGNHLAVNWNTNGTYDFGHMQINSSWFKALGPVRWAALSDPCHSTRTGAWILRQCINKYGYTWQAVGCYHSQTPDKRDKYAAKVYKAIMTVSPQPILSRHDKHQELASTGQSYDNR